MDEIIMPEINIPEEDLQRMTEALDAVAESIKVVADAIVQVFKQIADNLCETFSGWRDSILKCFGNKRVVHLVFHAKKKTNPEEEPEQTFERVFANNDT